MLSALRAYPTLTHSDNLGGWLYTIAHRKVIDMARARARRAIPVADVPERGIELAELGDGEVWRGGGGPPPQKGGARLRGAAPPPPPPGEARGLGGREAA